MTGDVGRRDEGAGPRIGVCVVRAEDQDGGLRITVTTVPDIARGTETVQTVIGAPEAVLLVSGFLQAFSAASPGPGPP